MLRWLSALCCIFALVACSSNDEKDAESIVAELVDFDSVVKAKRLWKANTGEGSGRQYLRLVPAIEGDMIYIANAKGGVHALTQKNGKRQWRISTDYAISGGVDASPSEVVFGTLDGQVVAVSATTGAELWVAKVSSEVLGPPATDGKIVVAQTIDARVYAFDAKTGEQRWLYDHIAPVLSLRGSAGPVMTSTAVICAFDNGQLLSFDKDDGSRLWDVRISQPKGKTDLERIVDVDGTPVVDSGIVYAGSYQGNIMALSRAQGKAIWRKPASTYQALAVTGGRVIVSTDRSRVIAYNAANGDIAWQNEALLNRELSAPAVVDDYVAVIDGEDYLHILALTDGSFVHRLKPSGSGFHSPLLSHQGKLYILSDDGVLSVYELAPR